MSSGQDRTFSRLNCSPTVREIVRSPAESIAAIDDRTCGGRRDLRLTAFVSAVTLKPFTVDAATTAEHGRYTGESILSSGDERKLTERPRRDGKQTASIRRSTDRSRVSITHRRPWPAHPHDRCRHVRIPNWASVSRFCNKRERRKH